MNFDEPSIRPPRQAPPGQPAPGQASTGEQPALSPEPDEEAWLAELIREAAAHADPGIPPVPILEDPQDK